MVSCHSKSCFLFWCCSLNLLSSSSFPMLQSQNPCSCPSSCFLSCPEDRVKTFGKAKSKTLPSTFLINVHFFIWLHQVLVVARRIFGLHLQHVGSLVAACELLFATYGIFFPDQGSNPGLHLRECRVLDTGPPRKSLNFSFIWKR